MKDIYERWTRQRNLMNQEVTLTFADGSEQGVVFKGLTTDNHGTLCAVLADNVNNPYSCSLVHFSRIKELTETGESKAEQVWGDGERMWTMFHKHLEGVVRAVKKKDDIVAFRIAADAVSCLFDAIRLAKDGK